MSNLSGAGLRGARISAGYMVASDAADSLSIPRNTYLRAESGRANLTPHLANVIAGVFGVSELYLVEETVSTPGDALALRIKNILATQQSSHSDLGANAVSRLKAMRIEGGYRSAKSAADTIGWKFSSYTAHE